MKNKPMLGQTTMILLVFIVLIFIGMGVFLFSLAESVSQEDYMDLYVNNLLLSIMRTSTGEKDVNCKTVSDLVACSFVMPDWICGDSRQRCLEMSRERISEYIEGFEMISKNYRYAFQVTSQGFVAMDPSEGKPMELIFGDEELIGSKEKKRTANYAIQKKLGGSNYNLKVTLIISQKEPEEN